MSFILLKQKCEIQTDDLKKNQHANHRENSVHFLLFDDFFLFCLGFFSDLVSDCFLEPEVFFLLESPSFAFFLDDFSEDFRFIMILF